jgi:uncharacterized repeat protein (TIGR03803 family)
MRLATNSFAATLSACLFLVLLVIATTSLGYASATAIYNFTGGSAGLNPNTGLTFDAAGNLYGTTWSGGTGACTGGCGTVFRLTPWGGSWTESVVYDFQGTAANDGYEPSSTLIADAAGNFYGTTNGGGSHDCGTVFELSPGSGGSWTETVLYSFCSQAEDGVGPWGKLVFDASGNLWGVTAVGGSRGGGIVFELVNSSGSWTESNIYDFPKVGSLLGSQPAGIIFDSLGNLYGVTAFGGTKGVNGAGVVFQLVESEGQWTQTVLHRFPISGNGLQTPTGGLIFDAAGTLYVSTARGGHGGAGVFSFNLTTNLGTTLHSFTGSQVLEPYEGLVFDSAGNLYSASYNGGGRCQSYGCGFVYELSPGSTGWTATVLAQLNGKNGANAVGGVVLDSEGNIYGATFLGGTENDGVIFQIVP